MMTRNLQIALHLAGIPVELPENPPTQNGMILAASLPNTEGVVETSWTSIASAGISLALPQASAEGQVLMAGPAPGFNWGVGSSFDRGNF